MTRVDVSSDIVFSQLERQFENIMGHMLRGASYRRTWTPRTDVYESDKIFFVVVALAGVEAGQVNVEVDAHQVTISGERSPHVGAPDSAHQCLQLEIPYGGFERLLVLPATVDPATSVASFENGLLIIRLAKLNRRPTKVRVE